MDRPPKHFQGVEEGVLDTLVAERYGLPQCQPDELELYFKLLAIRRNWTFQIIEPSGLASFEVRRWRGQRGEYLGSVLQRGGTSALVPQEKMELYEPRIFLAKGALFEAMSAEGAMILPEPIWLGAEFSNTERERLMASQSGKGWEAYSFRYWQPTSRGETLFNFWD